MKKNRKPFQAALGILRSNLWYFIISYALVALFLIFREQCPRWLELFGYWLCYKVFFINTLALVASTVIYDFSSFFTYKWLDSLIPAKSSGHFLNITAGVDETSAGLEQKFTEAKVQTAEIFSPDLVRKSIIKMRKITAENKNAILCNSPNLPFADQSMDYIFITLSGHDFKKETRVKVLLEAKRCLKEEGSLIVTEPLADIPNFLAYNLGCLNYLFHYQWKRLFEEAGLSIKSKKRPNWFIQSYELGK